MKAVRAALTLWLAAFCAVALAQARELPDFTRLVDDQGNAVVNISTTQAVRRSGAAPQVPGIEDEEVLEFFRRFIPRQQPGQPGPRSAPRAARSARASSSAPTATSSPTPTWSTAPTRSPCASPTSASSRPR